jgi:N-dimethylarginine dimethylaminohydrolase
MVGEPRIVLNEKATEQSFGLYLLLTEMLKASVKRINPEPGLPDMVFSANAAAVRNKV